MYFWDRETCRFSHTVAVNEESDVTTYDGLNIESCLFMPLLFTAQTIE